MISITEAALDAIKTSLEGKDNACVRIYIAGYGWGGPSLGMALDEPKDNDESVDGDGFKLVADKDLLEQMGGVQVDYRDSAFGAGFIIRPKSEHLGGSCACWYFSFTNSKNTPVTTATSERRPV